MASGDYAWHDQYFCGNIFNFLRGSCESQRQLGDAFIYMSIFALFLVVLGLQLEVCCFLFVFFFGPSTRSM